VQTCIGGLALKVIKIPNAHCMISRAREKVLLLEWVQRDGHDSVSVGVLVYFLGFRLLFEFFN
jgi:hypothetical protein